MLSHSLSRSLRKGRWKGSRGEKEGRIGKGKDRKRKEEERERERRDDTGKRGTIQGREERQKKKKDSTEKVKVMLYVYAYQIESRLACRRTSDYQPAAKYKEHDCTHRLEENGRYTPRRS